VNIADDFSVGDDVTGVNFGSELSIGADREFAAFQGNRSVHDAVDLQIFSAGDVAFDSNACAETRNAAGRIAAELRRRGIERDDS